MEKTNIYKKCNICNKDIKYQNHWLRHTKSKTHIYNKKLYDKDLEIEKLKEENKELKKEIEELKKQNIINNNCNNTTNNITNNNIIINFGDELVELTDDFLFQITDTSLLNQEKRKMIENYISSKQKTLKKTNMRDDLMHILENDDWKVMPEKLALRKRISNIPYIYRKSAINTINNWEDEEITENDKKDAIKTHSEIARKIKNEKFTKEQNKELETIIKCNAYNNKV
jgi:hypothetical protein